MTTHQSEDWPKQWFAAGAATYLNFAAHAALPRVSIEAVQKSILAKTQPQIVDDVSFFGIAADLRRSLATLIAASPDEIALITGAGAGLSAVALALKWSERDEVVIARGEFPTHYATWKPMEAREGIKLVIADPRRQFITAEDLIASLRARTRVVSVSHVRFDDGSMLDVPALAAACRKNGTLLVLDVSQSCGAVPISVRDLGADVIVCAGYKYLLSPWGTGFIWVEKSLSGQLLPGPYNWLSQDVETFSKLNYVDPPPAPTMSRWDAAEASSVYNFNLTVMEASLRFILDARVDSIREHTRALIDQLFEQLPASCRAASPLDASRRGPFGCIDAGNPQATQALYQGLRNENFVVALREGRIRVAPHLLNDEQDIRRFVAAITKVSRSATCH
jgi:cysteine desulfurase / selenocysteine lyase